MEQINLTEIAKLTTLVCAPIIIFVFVMIAVVVIPSSRRMDMEKAQLLKNGANINRIVCERGHCKELSEIEYIMRENRGCFISTIFHP